MPTSAEQPQLQRTAHLLTGDDFISGIERGMVFWARVSQSEALGSEHYHQNPCPWVVLSSPKIHARFPLVQVAPLTSKIDKVSHPCRILVPSSKRTDYDLTKSSDRPLSDASLVLTEQLRVFAHERLLGGPVAILSKVALMEVEAALKYGLDLA